ncbi:GNAT family N-acetyltransferase [Streptomyces sp. DT2A-34]|uniref:GNAT family N-acetyltransferase n=1 Tax=Streptomyces sp. DT2A-34 TaxID=3051182 RepID=UPI00265BF3CE|nr:GNAT family N-acetyltransferase [Streptomyces sp. DT2A-34]MDO0909875.1 GNAT family N-acetyltransferase [Streptomyces sp. DT2A-34]
MAGVCTHPATRGRGPAQAVCGFVVDDLVHRYGRAALIVDAANTPAIAAHERLEGPGVTGPWRASPAGGRR